MGDLAKRGLTVVLCDSSAPCGKFADQVLANAKVKVTPKSREQNVKATLSKVELGEADAAIVYVSDVASSGKVEGVAIPDDVNVLSTLPIVALKGSSNSALSSGVGRFRHRARGGARHEVRFPRTVTRRAAAQPGEPSSRRRGRRRCVRVC